MSVSIQHPAKYSDALFCYLWELLAGARLVLDPFAGSGKLRLAVPGAVLVEIEYPWAKLAGGIQGDALSLPFAAGTFDAVCTSPTYGNRMADHHEARDKSRRNTYRHVLGRPLHPHNSGGLQWGESYRAFHLAAWREVRRVLTPGGRLILNISDHIRKGQTVEVSSWHVSTLEAMGFTLAGCYTIPTPRNRFGANGGQRVGCEYLYSFRGQP